MLEITGEYIPLDLAEPTATRWQVLRSWFWPVTIMVESHGADWVRYLTFENTFKLIRGRWHRRGKRVISTEDLRERNERDHIYNSDDHARAALSPEDFARFTGEEPKP